MKLRWKELFIAFLMAVVLWYGVSGSEKMESQIEVRVDYRGLPQGLVVKSGLLNRVTVRVRASAGMLRSLAGRDFAFFVDLADVAKGENTLPINTAYLPFRGGVEVMDVTPSRIILNVDTISSKTVPLEADIHGELPKDMAALATFDPPEVTLTGATSLIEPMKTLRVPVRLENPVVPGTTETRRPVTAPDGIDAAPAEAKVTLRVGLKRKQVKVTRTVQVDAPGTLGKFVRPDKVSITLNIPESLAAKAGSSQSIKAFANLERHALGTYSLPVRVALPEGSELVSIDPGKVSVTLEQKKPAPKKK